MDKKIDLKSSFGGGFIAIAAVALLYIFGGGQDPKEATTNSIKQVYEVAEKGEKLCTELESIDSLTEEQKKTVTEAKETFDKISKDAEALAQLLKIDLTEENKTEEVVVEEVVVEEVVKEEK